MHHTPSISICMSNWSAWLWLMTYQDRIPPRARAVKHISQALLMFSLGVQRTPLPQCLGWLSLLQWSTSGTLQPVMYKHSRHSNIKQCWSVKTKTSVLAITSSVLCWIGLKRSFGYLAPAVCNTLSLDIIISIIHTFEVSIPGEIFHLHSIHTFAILPSQ